jgi:signal transduction histidine kinase
VTSFFSPDLAAAFLQDDAKVIRSGHPLLNREEPIIDRLGNKRWHSTTKVPLRNSQGDIIGLVAISRDITERKLAEQALQEANTELARHKDELQRTLTELQKSHEDLKSAQFQLIQAEKMQSLGRLAAGVAHEVKNPLGILRMGIDYLRKNFKMVDPDEALMLEDMADAIHRADGIILGLLDFSAPRALDCQHEDLSAIIEQSLGLVRHALSEANIKLKKDLASDLPPLWLDKNKIKQVFVNLLTNAIHAMPAGGSLSVRTYARQDHSNATRRDEGSRQADQRRAGETVVIAEVMDTGSGIPEHKLPHIYEPFFTTKETGKGTGLGLTVTRKIMELHGGTIEIGNRKEGGVLAELLFKI